MDYPDAPPRKQRHGIAKFFDDMDRTYIHATSVPCTRYGMWFYDQIEDAVEARIQREVGIVITRRFHRATDLTDIFEAQKIIP